MNAERLRTPLEEAFGADRHVAPEELERLRRVDELLRSVPPPLCVPASLQLASRGRWWTR
jgi:hypothetical protein